MTAQDKLSKDKLSKDKLIIIQSTSVDGVNGNKYTVRHAKLYDKCVYKRL